MYLDKNNSVYYNRPLSSFPPSETMSLHSKHNLASYVMLIIVIIIISWYSDIKFGVTVSDYVEPFL